LTTRDIYIKIEVIPAYNPVDPESDPMPPKQYRRDCMRNSGHLDGTIPLSELNRRRLDALVYREYLDPNYTLPKPDKLVLADINEPIFFRRVPSALIYAHAGERLRIHVLNADNAPHSLHMHGLAYGIDSAGAFPFGNQTTDGRRSDEICPGQTWTYIFDIKEYMEGVWPFHDHYQNTEDSINRGLFGAIIVLPREMEGPQRLRLPPALKKILEETNSKSKTISSQKSRAYNNSVTNVSVEAQLALMKESEKHREFSIPDRNVILHVPLFYHVMNGSGVPAFNSGDLHPMHPPFEVTFGTEGQFSYHCTYHPIMQGTVKVETGGATLASVRIVDAPDMKFDPSNVVIAPGGKVRWEHNGQYVHTVTDDGGGMPSFCFNGRAYVGNTPTIVAHSGQKIRWYVCNLDLGMMWHNFHLHGQRWRFANETIDVRSMGPAESFVVETVAPPVLLLPPEIEESQEQKKRPKHAKKHVLRGDFLFHCHVHMHMVQGMVGLVRSLQEVWLTKEQADKLSSERGLPIDSGSNACPDVDFERCARLGLGKWEEVPGTPDGVTMMHAVLLPNLPNTNQVLYWGYGPRTDQSRVWDQSTGNYLRPARQPSEDSPNQNIWSGSHAFKSDGTILVHGGFYLNPAGNPSLDQNTERLSFIFDPTTLRWSRTGMTNKGRFYPTSITLSDGHILTLYGVDNFQAGAPISNSIEIYDPNNGTWGAPIQLTWSPSYLFYPWTYLLPGGELFIAGPQDITRRFSWQAPVDDPNKRWPHALFPRASDGNMQGTSVLLPLRPPNYEPRVVVAGGEILNPDGSINQQATDRIAHTVEMIDLSEGSPSWRRLSDMRRRRTKPNSVLLPDGRVLVAGGILDSEPDGGPVEIFDPNDPNATAGFNPNDPNAGWTLGPSMRYKRMYHSSAILLPDGSVLMGGDPVRETPPHDPTPHERYLPGYYFKPRPEISSISTATLQYGSTFSIQTPDAPSIAEVVLIKPGAVTHGFNMSQRYVGCSITGRSANSIVVQAPPDGNIAPPGYYLLFIVNGARVPSVAKWVRIS
jgi:FtsP/CotA-like multicopper oxidase with cupredoxin domain